MQFINFQSNIKIKFYLSRSNGNFFRLFFANRVERKPNHLIAGKLNPLTLRKIPLTESMVAIEYYTKQGGLDLIGKAADLKSAGPLAPFGVRVPGPPLVFPRET